MSKKSKSHKEQYQFSSMQKSAFYILAAVANFIAGCMGIFAGSSSTVLLNRSFRFSDVGIIILGIILACSAAYFVYKFLELAGRKK